MGHCKCDVETANSHYIAAGLQQSTLNCMRQCRSSLPEVWEQERGGNSAKVQQPGAGVLPADGAAEHVGRTVSADSHMAAGREHGLRHVSVPADDAVPLLRLCCFQCLTGGTSLHICLAGCRRSAPQICLPPGFGCPQELPLVHPAKGQQLCMERI